MEQVYSIIDRISGTHKPLASDPCVDRGCKAVSAMVTELICPCEIDHLMDVALDSHSLKQFIRSMDCHRQAVTRHHRHSKITINP
jgi:hypothetical protein